MVEELHWPYPRNKREERVVKIEEEPRTYVEAMNRALTNVGARYFLGTRSFLSEGKRGPYYYYTFADAIQMIAEFARGFRELGIAPGSRVGIFARNRTEWVIADAAFAAEGIVTVPLYDSQTKDEMEFIVENSEMCAIVISPELLPVFRNLDEAKTAAIEYVIAMDDRMDDRAWMYKYCPEIIPAFTTTRGKVEEACVELDNKWRASKADAEEKLRILRSAEPASEYPYGVFDDDRKETYGDHDYPTFRDLAELPFWKKNTSVEHEACAELVTHAFSSIRAAGFAAMVQESGDDGSALPILRIEGAKDAPNGPDDLRIIVYTSGSSGTPKGAMLSYANVQWTALTLTTRAAEEVAGDDHNFGRHDLYISFLPLPHVFAYMMMIRQTLVGEASAFYTGDVRNLFDDIQACRPTMLPGVPRIYQRIYDKIMDGVKHASFPIRTVFNTALAQSRRNIFEKGHMEGGFLNKRIFKKFRKMFGGRVRLMYTGSAPLPGYINETLQCLFTPHLVEGYGLSETAAGACCSHNTGKTFLNCGTPCQGYDIKLRAVEELGYNPTDQARIRAELAAKLEAGEISEINEDDIPDACGELLIRGPSVFLGYWRNEEATKAAFDEEGYFCTGDIAMFTKDEHVRIIDRARNVFKLSQGVFIQADKCNNFLNRCPLVESVYTLGSSKRNFVIAAVVPDAGEFPRRFKKAHPEVFKRVKRDFRRDVAESGDDEADDVVLDAELLRRLCRTSEAISFITESLGSTGRAEGLRSLELPKSVIIDLESWSVENGLMTPSSKLKLPALKKRYTDVSDAVYDLGDVVSKSEDVVRVTAEYLDAIKETNA